MIRTLRKKFIGIAMLSLLGTMAVLCATIGIGNYYVAASRADKAIDILYQNDGEFPVPDGNASPSAHTGFQVTPETPFETRYFIVRLTAEDAVSAVDLEHIAALGMTTGDLTALFSYATQILMALMMLSMVFTMIIISLASARRIAEVLAEKTDIANPTGAEMTVRDGSIRFEQVSFAYAAKADKKVLRNIDLSIASGQTVGIIGGTGSSKSSLVQLIPRLYDVSSGRLLLGGVDVRKYDLDVLRNAVAMVLQKNELFSGTIKENLRWGNESATDEEIEEACRLACADEFIQSFPDKYDTYIEQGGANVSGGQKQRLCIARALLKNPKVLILDDSTSAVDTKTDASIQKSFAEFIPDTTKIIIAQRVSSVQHADLIVVMDEGKIVATGRHEELLKTCDIYKEVYESQKKGDRDHE